MGIAVVYKKKKVAPIIINKRKWDRKFRFYVVLSFSMQTSKSFVCLQVLPYNFVLKTYYIIFGKTEGFTLYYKKKLLFIVRLWVGSTTFDLCTSMEKTFLARKRLSPHPMIMVSCRPITGGGTFTHTHTHTHIIRVSLICHLFS